MLTSENPDQLGPQGVIVRCDQLTVVQMLLPVGGRRAVELEALGNAVAENVTFRAGQPNHLRRGQGLADPGRQRPERRRVVAATAGRRSGLQIRRQENLVLAENQRLER